MPQTAYKFTVELEDRTFKPHMVLTTLEIPDCARIVRNQYDPAAIRAIRCDRAKVKKMVRVPLARMSSHMFFAEHEKDSHFDDVEVVKSYSMYELGDKLGLYSAHSSIFGTDDDEGWTPIVYSRWADVTPRYPLDTDDRFKCGSGIHAFIFGAGLAELKDEAIALKLYTDPTSMWMLDVYASLVRLWHKGPEGLDAISNYVRSGNK